ncbi:hypothetical protein OUZ56_016358 [Daphnia magna]|uniref:Uncharacterized protein n=1 Tax=Daphnia magna TaxID=35525 RepID=A0ABR0AQF7_9CRUS|nr:hypothetical protein OUZ56_016358 [Daphnia magna]
MGVKELYAIGLLLLCKKSHLAYLLELMKEHRPQIDFDTLPSSGKQLMFIDGRDMPQPYTTTYSLLGNGRYTHFGLETAQAGDSPVAYFSNADSLQYAAIFKTNPNALPLSIQKRLRNFMADWKLKQLGCF